MTLYTVKDEYPDAVKSAVSEILPLWLEAFRQILEVEVGQELQGENWDGLGVRIAVFNVRPGSDLCPMAITITFETLHVPVSGNNSEQFSQHSQACARPLPYGVCCPTLFSPPNPPYRIPLSILRLYSSDKHRR